MATANIPSNLPICEKGTRPTNIIIRTTRPKMNAVEKFSKNIRTIKGTETHRMYLNAWRSAPFSVCKNDKINATPMTTTPLANSEGWKVTPTPGISSQRAAPLVMALLNDNISRQMTATGPIRKG